MIIQGYKFKYIYNYPSLLPLKSSLGQLKISSTSHNINISILLLHTVFLQVSLARSGVNISDLQSAERMMSLKYEEGQNPQREIIVTTE